MNSLLIIATLICQSPGAPPTVVLTASGGLQVETLGQNAIANPGAELRPGDWVDSRNGAASLLVGDGLAIYLAPKTRLRLGSNRGSPFELSLKAGEIRVISDGRLPTTVLTDFASVPIPRCAVRIAAPHDATYIRSEQGVLHARSTAPIIQHPRTATRVQPTSFASGRPFVCTEDREVVIRPSVRNARTPEESSPTVGHVWTVDSNATILDSACDCGRHSLEEWAAAKSQTLCDSPHDDTVASPSDPAQAPSEGEEAVAKAPPTSDPTSDGALPPPTSGGTDADANLLSTLNSAPLSVVAPLSTLAVSSPGFGANNPDAQQSTNVGQLAGTTDTFPGAIHLVASETRYAFSTLDLRPRELNQFLDNEYWSIGIGTPPTTQVTTSFLTGSAARPRTIAIPGTNAYLIRLDQYAVTDPVGNDPSDTNAALIGFTGLLGDNPVAPTVTGATPLLDNRGATDRFNSKATFAFGEFRVGTSTEPDSFGAPEIAVRRSAQDRRITKDPNGNDANDVVTLNPEITAFDDLADPRFQPSVGLVKVPRQDALPSGPTSIGHLDRLRRAALTTLTAEKLFEFSRRTKQTRFVLDGQIIDISGYRGHAP